MLGPAARLEGGKPPRRQFTADTFRALKLRVSALKVRARPRPAPAEIAPPEQNNHFELPAPMAEHVAVAPRLNGTSFATHKPESEAIIAPLDAEIAIEDIAEAAADETAPEFTVPDAVQADSADQIGEDQDYVSHPILARESEIEDETDFSGSDVDHAGMPADPAVAEPSEAEEEASVDDEAPAIARREIAEPEIAERDEDIAEPEIAALAEAAAEPEIAEQDEQIAEAALPVEPETDGRDEILKAIEAAAFEAAPDETEEVPAASHDNPLDAAAEITPPPAAAPQFVPPPVAEDEFETAEVADPKFGEMAQSLLEIMAIPSAGSLPQERALAADTLLKLLPQMPLKNLLNVVARVSVMEEPSSLLVQCLISDPRVAVSGPLLESGRVTDRDLIAVIAENNPVKLRVIARRRVVSAALSEALIETGDAEALINLVRNAGAAFSIEALRQLAALATVHPALQAPLVTRADIPAPIAFELFWCLPSELRRYVLSRFLTDTETINKILKISGGAHSDGWRFTDLSALDRFTTLLSNGLTADAAPVLATLANVSLATAAKIVADGHGEALTVALKAAALTRLQFSELMRTLRADDSLKTIFDTLSFNKARVLLIYWDWAVKNTGPYARAAA